MQMHTYCVDILKNDGAREKSRRGPILEHISIKLCEIGVSLANVCHNNYSTLCDNFSQGQDAPPPFNLRFAACNYG